MGYYIRALPWKKSAPRFKIQFISYKNNDVKNPAAKKPKKEWDLRKDRWRTLGFNSGMDVTDARARAKQLNAQAFLKRQEEHIQKQELDRKQTLLKNDAALPEEFVKEFELRFIRVRDSGTILGKRQKTRARMIWQAAQKMIIAVNMDPSEWFYYTHEIYDHFYERQLSIRYMRVILKFANLWGYFICRKLAKPFLPIRAPSGYERQRLIEAYYSRQKRRRLPSRPLEPEHLRRISDKLNRPNFNWLHLSVWFGLRPQEIDNLKNNELWSIETLATGRKVLWVFQTKLIALPPQDRWKPIPILFDEQHFGLSILGNGDFKRPLVKTVKKYFGPEIDLYGGRKGFSDLMLSRGQSIENISIWMGHSTLDRTWRTYKDRRRYHLNF